MQAVTTPLARTFALGGLLLALGIGANVVTRESSCPSTHKLTLHAPVETNAFYLTAFHDGPVYLELDVNDLPKFEIRSEAWVYGCHWRGIETLVPIDSKTYSYDYDEEILRCEPGHVPVRKTPRQGYVTVE